MQPTARQDLIYTIPDTMRHQFYFSKVNISLIVPRRVKPDPVFQHFEGSGLGETAEFVFLQTDTLNLPEEERVYEGELYQAYDCGRNILRSYSEQQVPFAICRYDIEARKGVVEYTKQAMMTSTEQLFRYIAFDAVMMSMRRLLFHAALVETPWGGILFSGPSGVGKSTQAALWETHRGACQINGDRPIVYCDKGRWMASGSPYAGSSHCYVNRAVPVAAIVFLEQDSVCEAESMRAMEAFRQALQGTVVNQWNRHYMDTVTALLSDFVTQIPCCRLRCTPDIAAVEALEQWLTQHLGGVV